MRVAIAGAGAVGRSIAGELLDYVNKLIETVVIAGEKNPKVTVTITI